ncbi:MAG: cell envelope integrity protein CreD [Bacteroidales bacterium]|jgi:inner membrane protein|nr:cell envelope integrity protein CreD [Bacteroidales bacterium]
MENENATQEKWYQSMTVKMVLLGILGLMLMIPLVLIMEVIRERSQNAESARAEIGSLWASAQTVTGPVLNVPGTKVIADDGRYVTTTLHILPDDLKVNGVLVPEIRYRGIYETVVYTSELELSGSFSLTGYDEFNEYTWQWDKAYISLGVSDNKGISDRADITIGGKVISARPGAVQTDLFDKGISFPLPVDASQSNEFRGDFTLRLGLRGSGSIAFAPVGKSTGVSLTSEWEAPKFTGSFLPAERDVTDTGFTASWTVTHLNRSFPQVWTGKNYVPSDDAFGVDLIMESDHYTKAERSAKYGLLFIALTFLVLIIIELRSEKRVHIFYYLLVALALILFFSLLTALSEHIGFNPAYLISSAATIGLLTAFFGSLLKKRWMVLLISGLLTVLYLFIFFLLAMKDYAFLAGNIGLFVLLAVLMLVSAKYRLFRE